MRACSRCECSGAAMVTSSTFSNWCWRISPRVSRPAEPASDRKHGVSAVSRIGSSAAVRICSRTLLVRLTSDVEISQRPSVVWNRSSANLGSCPTPNTASSRTRNGVAHSSYPAATCRVEHELAQRPVHPCDAAAQERETRAGDFGCGLEVHAQRRADVGVLLGREIELRDVPPTADLDIACLIRAIGHIGGGQVGQGSQPFGQRSISYLGLLFQIGKARLERRQPRPSSASAVAASFCAIACPMSLDASLRRACACLRFVQRLPPAGIERQQLCGHRIEPLARQCSVKGFGVFADEFYIVHGPALCPAQPARCNAHVREKTAHGSAEYKTGDPADAGPPML